MNLQMRKFQYNFFGFNLKFKSSSFIANNTVLVLNYSNSKMRMKNLKNYSHFVLNDYQLENSKEKVYDLNNKLINHMYSIQLPHLIKQK